MILKSERPKMKQITLFGSTVTTGHPFRILKIFDRNRKIFLLLNSIFAEPIRSFHIEYSL